MFDVDSFVNLDTEVSGQFSTEYQPIPEGEYPAYINSVVGRTTQNGDSILDIKWEITDPQVAEEIGRVHVTQGIFLDLTEDGSGLDMGKGKNVSLGRLLEALGLNGKPWTPAGLTGQSARVNVSHRISEGKTYEKVKSVSAA